MLRYILFDFDGTLADSKAVFLSAFNQLAELHRFNKIQPDDIPKLGAMTMKERLRHLKVPLYKRPLLTSKFLSLYQQSLEEVRIFSGIRDLLLALKESGYNVAIASSNDKKIITRILTAYQIEIADVYCSRSLFGKEKLLKKFLNHYKLKTSEVIYVGDEHRDAVACEKAGIKMIWVKWGYDDPHFNQPNPDHIADAPQDVIRILQKI